MIQGARNLKIRVEIQVIREKGERWSYVELSPAFIFKKIVCYAVQGLKKAGQGALFLPFINRKMPLLLVYIVSPGGHFGVYNNPRLF